MMSSDHQGDKWRHSGLHICVKVVKEEAKWTTSAEWANKLKGPSVKQGNTQQKLEHVDVFGSVGHSEYMVEKKAKWAGKCQTEVKQTGKTNTYACVAHATFMESLKKLHLCFVLWIPAAGAGILWNHL